MTRNVLILFTLVFFLCSCESVVRLDDEYYEPQISVSGTFTSDDISCNGRANFFEVNLAESRPITAEDNFKIISDASVGLYHNKDLLEKLIFDSEKGVYKSLTTVAEEGMSYFLKINHPRFGSVVANSFVPEPTPIHSVQISNPTGTPSNIIENVSIQKLSAEIEIEDPLDKNYYHLLFYVDIKNIAEQNPNQNSLNNICDFYFVNFDLEGSNYAEATINTNSLELYGAYFTDDHFKSFPAKISFSLQFLLQEGLQKAENMAVELRTVSKEYYDFHVSAIRNANTGANPFFNEPASVGSNIQNGTGIFAGYSVQRSIFRLQ